jgi:transcriptional regulator with XRE-family HTH domain
MEVFTLLIGDKIRELREKSGMTMSELSEKSGVSQGALSLIETGKRTPGTSTLLKIAKGLGVDVSEFAPLEGSDALRRRFELEKQRELDRVRAEHQRRVHETSMMRRRMRDADITIEIDNVIFTIDIKAFIRPEDGEDKGIFPQISENLFSKAFEEAVSTVIEHRKDEIMDRFMYAMDRIRNEFDFRLNSLAREISENNYRFNKDGGDD